MTKRKNHAPECKARVALEAIREELTLSELAKKYGVHSGQISTWKRTALDNMSAAFERRGSSPDTPSSADIEKLECPHSVVHDKC
jgi:transposase